MAVLRFVNSIQASPTLRLDLNLSPWSMDRETSFGVPPMRRSVTSSMLRDGEYVGASAYGNREIELVLNLQPTGGTSDAAATQLQLLQRELDRPMNLLQYTPNGATNPVFFRTFRASPDSIRFDPNRKQVRVTVLAEPFALGVREDIAAITVRNDPTLANGLFADLTGIKGDVETPLFLEYTQTSPASSVLAGFAVGVRGFRDGGWPTLYQQSVSMQQALDTALNGDATASGGDSSRCTFAGTPTNAMRLSGSFPNLTNPATAAEWGQYRILARVKKTVAADVIQMSIKTAGGSLNPASTLRAGVTDWHMIDLGVADPTGGMPTTGGYHSAAYRIELAAALQVFASRVSGTGSLDIDYLVFVPADECFGSWKALGDPGAVAAYRGVVDGVQDGVYIATTLTSATTGRYGVPLGVATTGRLPVVEPGDNRLTIVETDRKDSAAAWVGHTNTVTHQFTARYWPRYLLVRPVGT